MRIMLWVVVSVVLGLTTDAGAQWDRRIRKGTPMTADGKPDLNAPAPRTSDGKPDLSGVWETYSEARGDFPKLLLDVSADLKPGEVPFQRWAEELRKQRMAENSKDHPGVRCLPSGLPEKNLVPHPYKIVQTPELIVFLYESRTIYRQVFLDGRLHPKNANPAWQGYSVGHWDGDSLIIETKGYNGLTWLDMSGHPATEALRVIERFTRRSFGQMDLEMTIDDAKAYTKPWTVRASVRLLPDEDLIEYICEENNRDLPHMVGR
jgi:hypothetical protein